MIHKLKVATLVACALILTACASGVTKMDSGNSADSRKLEQTVGKVNVWLNEDAKKLVSDNLKFSPDSLKTMIERSLQSQNLLKPEAGQILDIEVTGFRVRSNFSAIMFGFMAGNDNVEGVVSIKDATGKILKKSKVAASYALGGIAGGQDDARMGWLYEEFTKHTVAELSGEPVKK
jgi:Domain of unknown function (DUF4410)